ncbi:MAG: xanthine dehydrogenase family protein molybdopterin-binding subunit [Chloroflexi bacterium]|nr:xanthine dehydrogenase family protein molybdopterin-binding subunit [Chloroflexota bacterium]
MEHSVVGRRMPRIDALVKVSGEMVYTADIRLPHALYGAVLGSARPHARIARVDTSRLTRLPGVKAVVTGQDCRDILLGKVTRDQPVLAWHKTRFIGELVAGVAAIDPDIALEALDLIEVDYEDLQPVFDPQEAMAPEAPVIHEDLLSYATDSPAHRYGNVCAHVKVHRCNVLEGFEQADFVFEDVYASQAAHQGYVEPRAAVAAFDTSGKVTVWATSSSAFELRQDLAEVLRLPMSKVRVILPAVGGDFGGKGSTGIEPVCALLARKAGRPVSIQLPREQDFVTSHPRHPAKMALRIATKRDGTLVAVEGQMVLDAGAYADTGPRMIGRCAFLQGVYRVPHVKIDGLCVYTNKISFGNCRAPGAPQATFAIESALDEIATRLGIDPLELRLKNAWRDGDRSSTGQVLHGIAVEKTLRLAASSVGWNESKPGPNIGRGIACGLWHSGIGNSSAVVKVNEDGSLVLLTGAVDQGAGCHTVLSQIAAECLGVSLDDLAIVTADTDATPIEAGAGSSRTTFTAGTSVKMAAEDTRRQLGELAARMLEANPADLRFASRMISVEGSPERAVSFAQVMNASPSGPIIGRGSNKRGRPSYDPSTCTGLMGPASHGHTAVTEMAEVEVDPETGRVEVLRLLVAQDVGYAINPIGVEGQIEGGATGGLGFALTEELVVENGKLLSANLVDYRMPTPLDSPNVESIIIEEPEPDGPFGAKGVGEAPIVPTAAAIAAAVYDAVGVRIKDLPITPEKVLRAIRERQQPFPPGGTP